MPNTDPAAKAWQEKRSGAFGRAVASRRNTLKLTASQLAGRTKLFGYPITRSTIARIEGNHRAGKIDLAEVVTLAMALETSPIQLLFPDLVDGFVEVLPNHPMTSVHAMEWFAGMGEPYPLELWTSLAEAGASEQDLEKVGKLNDAWFSGVAAVRHARRISSLRDFQRSLTHHPTTVDHPDIKVIVETANQLADAEDEARQYGLIVNDPTEVDDDG